MSRIVTGRDPETVAEMVRILDKELPEHIGGCALCLSDTYRDCPVIAEVSERVQRLKAAGVWVHEVTLPDELAAILAGVALLVMPPRPTSQESRSPN